MQPVARDTQPVAPTQHTAKLPGLTGANAKPRQRAFPLQGSVRDATFQRASLSVGRSQHPGHSRSTAGPPNHARHGQASALIGQSPEEAEPRMQWVKQAVRQLFLPSRKAARFVNLSSGENRKCGG